MAIGQIAHFLGHAVEQAEENKQTSSTTQTPGTRRKRSRNHHKPSSAGTQATKKNPLLNSIGMP